MRKISLLIGLATTFFASADWTGDPQLLYPVGTLDYANEIAVSDDGSVWHLIYHPNTLTGDEYDIPNVVYQYFIQRYDSEGNPMFDGEFGLLISEYSNISYTMVNQYLLIDNDNNAIVAVSDARNSSNKDLTYTLYKISPEGEFLWGEDGVALDPRNSYGIVAGMRMTQVDDGSYVVAWMHNTLDATNETLLEVEIQKVSPDGKLLWDMNDVCLKSPTVSYSYPYVVTSDDNQVILVYARGGNMDLYARKLDFDGSKAWANDVLIYSGGWGSIPLWTKLTVLPSGNGGVVLSWNDDRNFVNKESAYMSYVTSNGKLGFAGSSAKGDVKLGYSIYRAFNCVCLPAPEGDGFLAAWRETDQNQMWSQIVVQKVSMTGELLWDEDGMVISSPIDESYDTYAYIALHPALEGQNAVFALERKPDGNPATSIVFTGNIYLFDNHTGEVIEGYDPYIFSERIDNGELNALHSYACVPEQFWILQWEEQNPEIGSDGQSHYVDYPMIMRVNFDFSGMDPVDPDDPDNPENPDDPDDPDDPDGAVKAINGDAQLWKMRVREGQLCIYSHAGGQLEVTLYDFTGQNLGVMANGNVEAGETRISLDNVPSGAYIARIKADGKISTVKIIR